MSYVSHMSMLLLCIASLITITHILGLRIIPYALSIGRFDINMYKPYE